MSGAFLFAEIIKYYCVVLYEALFTATPRPWPY